MRLAALLAGLALCLAAPALALAAKISAAEAKSIFFGLDMGGVYAPDGAPWRECIEPSGATSYWFDGYQDRGRLSVRGDGALCFSYATSNYARQSCYWAQREGQGFRFTNVSDPEIVFLAKNARRVKGCVEDAPIS